MSKALLSVLLVAVIFCSSGYALEPNLSHLLVPASQEWSRASSLSFLKAVMADEQCSPEEAEILKRLVSPGDSPLQIDGLSVARPQGESLQVFRLLTEPQDILQLWKGGVAEMQALMDIASLSPGARKQVTAMVVKQLYDLYKVSEFKDGYKPLSDELKRAHGLISQLSPDSQRAARNLLYRACKTVDQARNDSMPDYLYEWLKN